MRCVICDKEIKKSASDKAVVCEECNLEIEQRLKKREKINQIIEDNFSQEKNKREISQNVSNSNISNSSGCLPAFIIIVIIIFFLWRGISGLFSSDTDNNSNGKPDKIDLMSYAQTVLDDNLNNPDYSSYKDDYEFVETGLRYKIEGKVNNKDFWMIIEFTDDTYTEYDLISLQVGNDIIYKK